MGTPEERLDHHFRCICPRSGPSLQLWVGETRGFLERLRILFGVPDLDCLLELYNSKFGVPPYLGEGLEIGEMDKYLFTCLGQDPEALVLDPPNHPVALCHWKLATRLLSLLPAGVRDQVLDGKEAEDPGPSGSPELVVSDSHFHLDSLLQYSGLGDLNQIGKYCREQVAVLRNFRVQMAVANFCWASTFLTIDYLKETLQTSTVNLRIAVGIHPTLAGLVDIIFIDRVLDLLADPQVSAFGEAGLDYFKGPSAELQQQLLDHLLSRAVSARKPIVLHCRDHIGSWAASRDTLRILARHFPHTTELHRHCFVGGLEEFETWVSRFPRAYFGFTTLLFHPGRNSELDEIVRRVPLSKILLEFDAPFLPGRVCSSIKFSSLWVTGVVAERVAELKGISVSEVCAAAVRNCQELNG